MPEGLLPKDVMLEMSIEELDLSERAIAVLNRYGVTKMGELVKLSPEDLRNMRNMGWEAEAVEVALSEVGLSLG